MYYDHITAFQPCHSIEKPASNHTIAHTTTIHPNHPSTPNIRQSKRLARYAEYPPVICLARVLAALNCAAASMTPIFAVGAPDLAPFENLKVSLGSWGWCGECNGHEGGEDECCELHVCGGGGSFWGLVSGEWRYMEGYSLRDWVRW